MADNVIDVRLQSAYKTAAVWSTSNPVLKLGEVGYESDTGGLFKIGNGTSTWNQLPYSNHRPLTNNDFDTANISTADVGCVTASSAAGATEHSAGTTGQALVSDGDSVYWGDPQHAGTTDEAQHATSAATLDDTEFIEDNEPYLFRTAPNEAGNRVYEDAIVGGSVAWNQLVQNGDFSDTSNWTTRGGTSFSVNNNVATVTFGSDSISALLSSMVPLYKNHVYLLHATIKSNDTGKLTMCMTINSGSIVNPHVDVTTTSNWTDIYALGVLNAEPSSPTRTANNIMFRRLGSDVFSVDIKNVYTTDLTLMFGTAIADYIYSLEQARAGSGIAWLKSYGFFTKDYYAYDAGGIESVKTSAKKVVGFNQWDEQWEVGSINGETGANVSHSSRFRSKNYIPALPNTGYFIKHPTSTFRLIYYDLNKNCIGSSSTFLQNKVLTTPENCYYIRFWQEGATYNHDICINIRWDGERDGEYEPYTEHTYPLDSTKEWRGLFKLDANNNLYADGDIYPASGEASRRYILVDLGTLTWTYNSTDARFICDNGITIKNTVTSSQLYNAICSKYVVVPRGELSDKNISLHYSYSQHSYINVMDSTYTDAATFKTAMNGVYLVCELATPTTESADPYTSPQIVDNWGTEEFVDERTVPIPVGHNSRYPKTDNYKLANIPAPPGGAGDYIVHTDEYGESVYQQASDIKVNYAGTADVGKRRIFIQGSQTTATTTGLWTGDASPYFNSADDLQDGQEITYWLPLPTTGDATLNLKFGDGTSSGAVDCYYSGTSRLTTHYGQGNAIHLTYRKNVKIPSTGSTTYTGWWADANYDTNSNTVSTLRGDYTYLVAGPTVGVKQYSLIARDANGKYSSFTSSQGTATSKPANRTDYFDISKIFYYNGSASVAANDNMSTATLHWAVAGADLRYSLNISKSALTVSKPVYLKFNANESTVSSITGAVCYKLGGTANDDYWSQTLPTSADGMIYVEIGRGTRDYRMDLAEDQHYYQYTDKLHEYDSWSAKLAEHSEFTDGTIVYKETVADNTNDGKLAFLEFTNAGIRKWNFPSTSSSTYISDKTSPCICRYNNGEMIYVDAGLVDVTLMQDIELTPNKMVYLNISSYNVFDDISASWGVSASPFTQTVTASDQMVLGIAVDSSHFYLLPDNRINDKKGRSGHAYARSAYSAERLSNNTQIGGGTSAVYFTNLGVPTPIDIAAITVNNATNAAKVNGTAFGSASTMASGAFASSSHTHTTADITSFTSAVDDRITRDKILGTVSTGATWTGSYSFVEGNNTTASGAASHAEGYDTKAIGNYAHAEGYFTSASSDASHAEGGNTTASGRHSHAEGYRTLSSLEWTHSEGYMTTASGQSSHAEGDTTFANGAAAHSEGINTIADTLATHAEGLGTTAKSVHSHSEGYYTLAGNATFNGTAAHAEGYQTSALSNYSHSEGAYTRADWMATHAEGYGTTATGKYSHAGGYYTIANKDAQTSIGKFNATVDSALFIVGNGSSAASTGEVRSNAMYVTTAGNINCVSVTQTSDERLKENIQSLTSTDKSILDVLEPKQFTLKADEKHQLHYGFIAQDVERQINALGFPTSSHSLIDIADNEQAYYSLNYTELIPLLVQKVKDLEARIAILEKNK